MNKNQYVEQEILNYTKFWGSFGLLAGALVFVSLSGLDYFVAPENFYRFILYRVICAFLMVIMFFFNRRIASTLSLNVLYFIAAITTAITVEIMILSSSYLNIRQYYQCTGIYK